MEEKEPWRIDKDSVHFKVLKGWLSERFRIWLSRACAQYDLSEDELLTRIIETIRRISCKVFEILKERLEKEPPSKKIRQWKIFQIFKKFRKKTNKDANIPIIIISKSPNVDLVVLALAIEKNYSSDILCNRVASTEKIGIFGRLVLHLEDITQSLAEISGGLGVFGSAEEHGIAIYDRLIMDFSEFNSQFFFGSSC